MNANRRELADEKLCWLAQHTAHGRVGRRVAPESIAAALSDRNDGLAEFFNSVSVFISARQWLKSDPKNSRSFAFIRGFKTYLCPQQ
jgi:hypothetical protein